MRRPAGVTVAASILGLMALFGLLGIALSFAAIFLVHNPGMPQAAAAHGMIAGFDLIFACFFVFCLWTVVGLFRLRRWARYSMIVIGILLFLLCGLLSAVMFVLPHFARTAAKAAASPAQLSLILTLMIAFGVFYAAIALVGLWWAVYFSLKRVRLAFAGGSAAIEGHAAGETSYGAWQVVVIAFACLMLVGVVFMLGWAWLGLPIALLGMIFHGNSARAVALLFAAIQLFVGVGLLARLRSAYWTAIGWQIFGVLSVAPFLVPGYAARVLTAGEEINRRFMLPFPANSAIDSRQMLSMEPHWLMLTVIPSTVIFLVVLYALLRCRRWYLGGGPAADSV